MQKFHVNMTKGAPRQIGNIFAKFLFIYTFFLRNSSTGQTPRRIFARDGANDAVSCRDVPFKG